MQTKYPINWAMTIVDRLFEKYGRGGEKFAESLGLTRRALALQLATGSREWPEFRSKLHRDAKKNHYTPV